LIATQTARRKWWQRWSTRFAVLFLAAAGGFYLLLHLTDLRLGATLARLDHDDPGWRFDEILAARQPIPNSENSAAVIGWAAAFLPRSWPPQDVWALGLELPPNERLSGESYGWLANELCELQPALAEAGRLAGMPRGRHAITYLRPNIYATMLPTHQSAREVARLEELNALQLADDGDGEAALTACRAIVNAGRSIGDEPLLISQLVRMGCVMAGCKSTERVLAQCEPPPAAMAALQGLLEDEEAFPALQIAVRGERAIAHEMVTALETGKVGFNAVAITGPGTVRIPAEQLLSPLLRIEYKTEHRELVGQLTRCLEVAQLPPADQAGAAAALQAEVRALPQNAILQRQLLPGVANAVASWRQKQASLRCQIACLAAERYRRSHGAWPTALADLTPAELSAAPADPFDGQPLRFRRLKDGLVIYSIAPHGIDYNGKLGRDTLSNAPGTDIGCRLWDPEYRGLSPGTGAHDQKDH
jgi:hypothetical protein